MGWIVAGIICFNIGCPAWGTTLVVLGILCL